MKKIFILTEKENWIVNEFEREWISENKTNKKYQYTNSFIDADIVWILSDYIAERIPKESYLNKTVITTIHHIVPWKVLPAKKRHFHFLNEITTYFTTIENKCARELKKYVSKPIRIIPFWNDIKKWYCKIGLSRGFNEIIRDKYNIPQGTFVIGSFQRDTEGAGIRSGIFDPKLEKGPDLFIEAVLKFAEVHESICVVLAGNRRQYVIKELEKNKIEYRYFEMCHQNILNELYNCLDLYIVASRVEGGPRAINECALTKTPLISTDVGIASLICYPDSIFDVNNVPGTVLKCSTDVDYNYNKALEYTIENYMDNFNEMIFN
jgi:glycosyltransferase involved in cell wall biosynthesis